jgi:tetratricopeptide (TPR) repeat protein
VTASGTTRQIADTLNQAARLDLLERAGRFSEADALVQTVDLPSLSPRQALRVGGYLERRRRGAEAVALYEGALSRRPADRGLAAALARARAGRPAPGMPSLKAGTAESLMIPAVAFAGGRQSEPALSYARMALHLNPRFDEAWVLVGDLLASAKDLDGARRAYGAIATDSELYAPARARLAVLLNENGAQGGGLGGGALRRRRLAGRRCRFDGAGGAVERGRTQVGSRGRVQSGAGLRARPGGLATLVSARLHAAGGGPLAGS